MKKFDAKIIIDKMAGIKYAMLIAFLLNSSDNDMLKTTCSLT